MMSRLLCSIILLVVFLLASPTTSSYAQMVVTPTPTRTPTPINIGNFVWDDLDRDGRQDAGEPGIPNITVQLWNANKSALLDSATTNANGNYTVTAPLPGTYRLRTLLPSGELFTEKDSAGDDQLDSDFNPRGLDAGFTDEFTLASNVISTTIYDAGIIVFRTPTPTRTPTPINIGNFVWNDLNGDGYQDVGEPGLNGITVQLWNSDKSDMIDQDTTSPTGAYTVIAPLPGDYRVRVLVPDGASFTLKDQGEDSKDSDINVAGFNFGFTDLISIMPNVISITSIDAGMINVPPTPMYTVTDNFPSPTDTATGTSPPTPSPDVTPQSTSTTAPEPELLLNGDFEMVDLFWIVKNASGDKVKCNKLPDKIIASSGNCAFRFKGNLSENARIIQSIVLENYTFNAGDSLLFQIDVNAYTPAASGKIKVRVKYTDMGMEAEKITIDLLETEGYQNFNGTAVLKNGSLSKIKVQINHRSLSGKVYIDSVSLKQVHSPGLVPLP
jgi:hypothetical protein